MSGEGPLIAHRLVRRRTVLKATAGLVLAASPAGLVGAARADDRRHTPETQELKMSEPPRTSATKVTVERRGHIVLIGINRPDVYNRIDPETYSGLGKAFYHYDHDPSCLLYTSPSPRD